MDFVDQVKAFASTIPAKLDSIKTEEATKHFLVMPFIQQILGYDAFSPNEVMPEFDANVGASTKYKLDYAIFQDGKPIILIECKCYGKDCSKDHEWSQLHHYFVTTDARIAILTDGVIYRFYSDLEKPNKMDKNPFLEIDLMKLKESSIQELKKLNLTKLDFDENKAVAIASRIKYIGGIKKLISQQLEEPDGDFVRFFFSQLCPDNKFVGKLKDDFVVYTKIALKEFIREEMQDSIDEVWGRSETRVEPLEINSQGEESKEVDEDENQKEFTENEREGFYVMKSILCNSVDVNRIYYRDAIRYCSILLDNNKLKTIVRFYFNNPQNKRLEIFRFDDQGERQSEMVSIENLNGIYDYSDVFREIISVYDK